MTISFSDAADATILDHSFIHASSGTFKPVEDFESHFKGELANGQWTLAIHDDKVADNTSTAGILYDWTLNLDMDHCDEGIRWSKLSSNNTSCERGTVVAGGELNHLQHCPHEWWHKHPNITHSNNIVFTPRYLHSAIAIGNDIYVVGGFAHGDIPETWRFNYASRTWIQLHGVHKTKMKYGQSAVLTPYGVIAFGGLTEGGGEGTTNDTSLLDDTSYFYNVVTEEKTKLKSDAM